MNNRQTVANRKAPLSVQRPLRRRASQLKLQSAVSLAVDALFQFTHRASANKALWSETEAVWLGRTTFLHWALDDADINVLWVVANAEDAPKNADDLRQAVRAELTAYWTAQLTALPRMSTGKWLPLP